MGGQASVRFVETRGPERARALARTVEREAWRIEAKFSRFREDSALSRINARAGADPVAADAETCALVCSALDLARLTGGRFDPTVGVFRRIWDFKAGRVPSADEIEALRPLVDASQVEVDGGAIHLRRPGMELDLGGVGKEYAVDRVAGLLLEAGVTSGIVDFAGDVRTLGRRGDGRPWSIGVQEPRRPGRCRFALRARDRAGIATSGDYERFFEKDGVRFHHLLDATTGLPARGVTSVTVIAPTALAAWRLATAAFLLGPVLGLALLEAQAGVEGALITEDDRLLATSGLGRIASLPSPADPGQEPLPARLGPLGAVGGPVVLEPLHAE